MTAGISLNIFLVHALEMCFLLRRRYAPFYKWVYTGFQHLPNGSQDFHEAIHILTSCISIKSKLQAIFRIMNDFKKELDAEIPTLSSVRFSPDADEASFAFGGFINVAQAVNDSISDSEFRKINYLHQAGAYDNR